MRQQRKICELGWSLINRVTGSTPDISLIAGIMAATGLQFNQYRDTLSLITYGAVLTGWTAKPRLWLRYESWEASTTPLKPTATGRGSITAVTRTTGGISITRSSTSILVKETATKISLLNTGNITTANVVKGDAENALVRL